MLKISARLAHNWMHPHLERLTAGRCAPLLSGCLEGPANASCIAAALLEPSCFGWACKAC